MMFGSEATVRKEFMDDTVIRNFQTRKAKEKVVSKFKEHINTHFRDSIEEHEGFSGDMHYKLSLVMFNRSDFMNRLQKLKESIPEEVFSSVYKIMTS